MSRASTAVSPGLCEARYDTALEKFQNSCPQLRGRRGFVIRRMGPDEMIDGRTRRGLAAFVEPEPRNHSRIIRAPDARHEARRLGVVAMMQAEVPMM